MKRAGGSSGSKRNRIDSYIIYITYSSGRPLRNVNKKERRNDIYNSSIVRYPHVPFRNSQKLDTKIWDVIPGGHHCKTGNTPDPISTSICEIVLRQTRYHGTIDDDSSTRNYIYNIDRIFQYNIDQYESVRPLFGFCAIEFARFHYSEKRSYFRPSFWRK
jgi:hypothetical protein